MNKGKIILISAVSTDGAIGHDSKLLWNIREDLEYYKSRTLLSVYKGPYEKIHFDERNCLVMVGVNTYLGLPRAAKKKRHYLVITGSQELSIQEFLDYDNAEFWTKFSTPQEAIKFRDDYYRNADIFIAGGSLLYSSCIDYCDEAEITWVNRKYPDANKRFPLDKLSESFIISEDGEWKKEGEIEYKFTKYIKK